MTTGPIRTTLCRSVCTMAGLALAMGGPAAAQIIPTGTPAADILLARALADQQMLFTCSSLDAETHAAVVLGWRQDASAASAILAANNVPADAIATFTTAAAPENLLPAPDTPYSEVKQFCDAYPDWPARWEKQDFVPLAVALPKAFQ